MSNGKKTRRILPRFVRRWIKRSRKEPQGMANRSQSHQTHNSGAQPAFDPACTERQQQFPVSDAPTHGPPVPPERSGSTTGDAIQIDISDVPDYFRDMFNLPPRATSNTFRIDAKDWAIAESNFFAPLNYHIDPDSESKTDEWCMVWDPGMEAAVLRAVPQYQHPDSPPPYKFAAVSSLPRPVNIGDSWSSLYAAQREKSRLLEIKDYVSSRLAEIDEKISSAMRVKRAEMKDLDLTALLLRTEAQLAHTSISDVSLSDVMPTIELAKINWIRERMSPVSLFWPGWDYEFDPLKYWLHLFFPVLYEDSGATVPEYIEQSENALR